jgi:methylenetetrahydrofolate dehydrogenase (NADP+)/methenyltetrahydrofolate cyclohydrolase
VIVDGKKIADEILASFGEKLRGTTLGVVLSPGDAAGESFVRIKERVAERLGVKVMRGELPDLLSCDGIIVQLPHPRAHELLVQLPPEKDPDALSPAPKVRAPVAEAVSEILSRTGTIVMGKKAAVVGEGLLVGRPVAVLLRELGADVVVVSLEHGSLAELRDADIVVLGAGSPGLVKPAMLKNGVVLLDAGTSESGGRVVGDADPQCAEMASVFTPVPGGIGPVAIAMLFKNLLTLKSEQLRG